MYVPSSNACVKRVIGQDLAELVRLTSVLFVVFRCFDGST